ncbi:unnamed protein product [Durusdinium trenchii]|uniref:Alpha N-terminal protein methyltransferase 1 n=1 Tax=Durusdinium trenchii TaxID=1381693 RepID=A0ABP0J3P3_9DINO
MSRRGWYQKAADHWAAQAATLDGVLGGFPETSEPDLRESRRRSRHRRPRGARTAKPSETRDRLGLRRWNWTGRAALDRRFERVDLVEPNDRLLEEAKKQAPAPSPEGNWLRHLGEAPDSPQPAVGARAERLIASSLEKFEPEEGRYDVIWAQWVLLYLTDEDLVAFLQRCKKGLRPNGMIFVKENVVIEGTLWLL